MIRLGSQIRLTRREVERFRKITDIEPVDIRTLDDLDAYIARCKAHYWGVSKDTQFLHWLIDREYAQCRLAASRCWFSAGDRLPSVSAGEALLHRVLPSKSPEDTRLDRRAAHEGEVGAGLADVPETGDDFFAPQHVLGPVGVARRLDAQVGFAVGGMAI